MPIFSANTPNFLVTDIILEKRITYFGNLTTGTDLAINFDLVKCTTKNKYSYLNYNEKVERRFSSKR